MEIISKLLILEVALEHFYILYLEMFAWKKQGNKILSDASPSFLQETSNMAANQGLYNGFLGAGLLWSLVIGNSVWSIQIACFFLSCVLIAAIFGGIRSDIRIIMKQGLPAILAILALGLRAII